jgi:diguanylate cyclase (GGDEF)-like protein
VIFFFGACFVLAVTGLSLRTALDVRRVAVLELENITDPLMAIHNRRYLERRLDEEVARASRYGLALSILMIDIDHFKNINDAFGHHAGDLVLTALGKLIADACRDSDIAARFGGEEIVIIAPNTTALAAVPLAERLRRAVESAALLPAGESSPGRPVRVTISIGVAELGEHARDVPGILASADKALYRAKNAGRNRVEFSASLDP